MLRRSSEIGAKWRIVDKAEALRAGVDPEQLRSDAHLVVDAAALSHVAAWSEEDLGDGWIVACRISSEDEKPVVAELRVFPDRWARGRRPAGKWSGDYLDVPSVPAGGLSATLIRRVKLASAFKDMVSAMGRLWKGMPDPLAARLSLPNLGEQPTRTPRIDDLALARLAAAYVKSNYSIRSVAQRLRLSESTVRGRVSRARQRGFLTHALRRGHGAGELTPRAEELLGEAKGARRRPARRGGRAR